MKDAKSICILGRLPALGLAELESLYGSEHTKPIDGAALLDIPAEEINFKRLGGSMKVARILTSLPYTDWPQISKYLKEIIPEHVEKLDEGKFTLGLSVYGLKVQVNDINKLALQIKKSVKASGRPVRVLQNKTLELNSAQVLYNKLTHRGSWEILILKNGQDTILAQTLFVQDIEAYAGRDQARPKRDARVGMLPPKLAQTIINLTNAPEGSTVLDPFCGTGVILQEALLMGYNVIGTDLEPRMVEYSKSNIDWLKQKYPAIDTKIDIEAGDATSQKWTDFDVIASEVYLGRAFNTYPSEGELKQAISDANTIIKKFLINLLPQLKAGQKVCLAVPAWKLRDIAGSRDKSRTGRVFGSAEKQTSARFISLPLLDHLTEMGYNYLEFKHVRNSELIYYREDQVVARQLIRLEKK